MITFVEVIELGFSLSLIGNALLFIPQIINIFRKKSAKDISLAMFLGFNVTQLFTILHAYLVNDKILMLGFGMAFILSSTVTLLILYYRKNPLKIIKNID